MLKSRGSVHWPLVPQSGQTISRHRNRIRDRRIPFFSGVRLLHVVLPVPLVAVQALDQRVVEHLDVTRGHPHLARQDDRAVQADDVVAAGDHRPPPLALDVLLELDAQRAVVPRGLGAAVDLAGLVDQATAFGQVCDGVDDGRHGCHSVTSVAADDQHAAAHARRPEPLTCMIAHVSWRP